jgi:hypothetical protein
MCSMSLICKSLFFHREIPGISFDFPGNFRRQVAPRSFACGSRSLWSDLFEVTPQKTEDMGAYTRIGCLT